MLFFSNLSPADNATCIKIIFVRAQFQSNPGVSKVVKEAAKKWEEAVNTYSKNLPEDLNPGNLAEKYEKSLKYITDHATELAKKADGNKDLEKEIIEFTKTQIDNLMTQVQTVKVIEIATNGNV